MQLSAKEFDRNLQNEALAKVASSHVSALVDYFISQLRNPNNFPKNALETAGRMQIIFFVFTTRPRTLLEDSRLFL